MGGGNVHVVATKIEWDKQLKEAGSKPVSTMSTSFGPCHLQHVFNSMQEPFQTL